LEVEKFSDFLNDGSLLNGKNQVADNTGILQKIDSQILNLRMIIMKSKNMAYLIF